MGTILPENWPEDITYSTSSVSVSNSSSLVNFFKDVKDSTSIDPKKQKKLGKLVKIDDGKLYARTEITKDRLIGEYVGTVTHGKSYSEFKVDCKDFAVDATKIGNELRFITSSDKSKKQPNVQFVAYVNTHRISVQTILPISEGKLLVADYKDIHYYETDFSKPIEPSSDEESPKSVYQTRKNGNSTAKLKFLDSIKPGTQLLYDKRVVTLLASGRMDYGRNGSYDDIHSWFHDVCQRYKKSKENVSDLFKKIYIKPTENDPWLSFVSFDEENHKLLPQNFDISDVLTPKTKVNNNTDNNKNRYLCVLNSLSEKKNNFGLYYFVLSLLQSPETKKLNIPPSFREPPRSIDNEGYGADLVLLDWHNTGGSSHYHRWGPTSSWNAKAFENACEEFGVDKLESLVNNILQEPDQEKNQKKRGAESLVNEEEKTKKKNAKKEAEKQVEKKPAEKPKPTLLDNFLKPKESPKKEEKDIKIMDLETDLRLLHKIYEMEKIGIDKQLALQLKTQILEKIEGIK